MKHFMRPYKNLGNIVLLGAAAMGAVAPPGACAQAMRIVQVLDAPNLLLLGNGSQGYLGVDVTDVDQEKAQAQGVYPRRRPDRLSAPDHRALGL